MYPPSPLPPLLPLIPRIRTLLRRGDASAPTVEDHDYADTFLDAEHLRASFPATAADGTTTVIRFQVRGVPEIGRG